MYRAALCLLLVFFAVAICPAIGAQQPATQPLPSTAPQLNAQDTDQNADPAYALPSGSRFLVGLEKPLSTKTAKAGDHFTTRTLEPLTAPDGSAIPMGAELRGHVSRVEPGGSVGRARIWLSFDDIHTANGALPIVAEVTQVPGEHSVKPGENKEGEIEARTSTGTREFEAAAAGAALGVSAGAVKGGTKGAAAGATMGALAGFLAASGLGQELELMEGTKLELELLRPLAIGRR